MTSQLMWLGESHSRPKNLGQESDYPERLLLQFSSVLTGMCHTGSTNYATLTPVDIIFSSLKAVVITGVCCDTAHNG